MRSVETVRKVRLSGQRHHVESAGKPAPGQLGPAEVQKEPHTWPCGEDAVTMQRPPCDLWPGARTMQLCFVDMSKFGVSLRWW